MLLIKNEVLRNCQYYPERSDIFKVFSIPLYKIKVVCLGQDPYPNGVATGLAFGINMASSIKIPASLRIIKAEVDRTVLSDQRFYKKNSDYSFRTLEHWWETRSISIKILL